jgi:hypothetical protein
MKKHGSHSLRKNSEKNFLDLNYFKASQWQRPAMLNSANFSGLVKSFQVAFFRRFKHNVGTCLKNHLTFSSCEVC